MKTNTTKKIVSVMIIAGITMSSLSVSAGPSKGPFPRLLHGPGPLFELIVVGTRHLFFRAGTFYHKGPKGYVPVEAPEGAVIPVLPRGYSIRIVDEAKYYYFNGIYYVRVPDGYMVVTPPVLADAGEEKDIGFAKPKGDVNVAVDLLNVRSGPGKQYPVAFLAYGGEVLKIYHESKRWLYVELPTGQLGWVDKQFTETLDRMPAG